MKKPIVLVIMDGVGRGDGGPGDAVKQANTPNLDKLIASCPMTWLKAHGTAVGLPTDDDMGNSEVGHNALGCGQIYSQGAKLVGESIESGALYESKTWKSLISNCKENEKALHFLGLLSDGNVHSNISHLIAMLQKARAEDVKRVYCHILLDGRDVPATSALEYVDQLETVLAELSDSTHEYKIASGGGRMVITMDRYEANWPMVEKGWRTHVQGEGRQFASAKEAIETYRAENPGMIDQDLLPFVVAHDGKPVAKIANGDSVILFNFRGDRAQEISLAFDRKEFTHFDRPGYTGVHFAGMLEYDGDLKIPEHYLVEPPVIKNTLTEVLCKAGVHEYAISETQKYGHVTYFWNGNRSGKVDESLEVLGADLLTLHEELNLSNTYVLSLYFVQLRIAKVNCVLLRELISTFVRNGEKKFQDELECADILLAHMNEGKPARTAALSRELLEVAESWFLLTMKKVVYAANIAEGDVGKDESELPLVQKVRADRRGRGLGSAGHLRQSGRGDRPTRPRGQADVSGGHGP